jgi:hypothetical protein
MPLRLRQMPEDHLLEPGLPHFSWCTIPKPERMYQNEHKMYQMVIKYPKCP